MSNGKVMTIRLIVRLIKRFSVILLIEISLYKNGPKFSKTV